MVIVVSPLTLYSIDSLNRPAGFGWELLTRLALIRRPGVKPAE
jgi:hypothetical protein